MKKALPKKRLHGLAVKSLPKRKVLNTCKLASNCH